MFLVIIIYIIFLLDHIVLTARIDTICRYCQRVVVEERGCELCAKTGHVGLVSHLVSKDLNSSG